MKILGYMQVHNEERFAAHSLKAVVEVVDNMIVVLDRCTDNTKETLSGFRSMADFQEVADSPNANEYLAEMMKSAFNDNKDYDWVFIVRGDEIYHESIKELKSFLLRQPVSDVSRILGHTIFVRNDTYTWYTHERYSPICSSSTLLFNNREIKEVLGCTRFRPVNMRYRGGSKTTFDARNGTPLFECPTSFHLHFLQRSSEKRLYGNKRDPIDYAHHMEENQNSLYPLIFGEADEKNDH